MNSRERDLAIGGAIIVLLVAVAAFFLWPYELEAKVVSRSWERTIYVERWQENQHEGWDVPQGGVIISSERRYRRSEEYQCGTTTTRNSDGTTTSSPKYCSRSIYDDWYTYRIWEWTEVRAFRKAGVASPVWPDASDIADTNPTNPERLGRRVETYTTVLATKDTSYTYTGSETQWEALPVGARCRLKTNRAGMVLEVRA